MPQRRTALTTAFAVLCLIALSIIDRAPPFAYLRLKNLYRDAVSRLGRKATVDNRLVFLAIDSDSVGLDADADAKTLYGLNDKTSLDGHALNLMAQRFPWPREIYALILERLADAGAKVVAFDLTFPTSTEGDQPFRAALNKYRDHVVIGSNFLDPSWSGSDRIGASHTRPPDSLVPQTNPMDDRVGYTNFWPDVDDVVRRANYRITFEQVEGRAPEEDSETFLSLAARALSKAGLGHSIPSGLEEKQIRFAGPARTGFPPHSIFEIFVPEYWKRNYQSGEFFRGKIVLVGAEGNWQHDEHQTPFGSMPGPELHLNAMNAAIRGDFISEVGARGRFVLTGAAAVLALLLCFFVRSPWARLLGLGLANGAAVAFALLAFNRANSFLPLVSPIAQLNLTVAFGLISDFASERSERKRLRRTFERYVSSNIVRRVLDAPHLIEHSLGGVLKPATILFSDIRGYSRLAARSSPHALVAQLNEYLSAMVECVFENGGTLDKFIGDAVMAVWGNVATAGIRQDATSAVRAALAMRVALERLNARWRSQGLPELRIGIAINHGDVIVGNIGSPQRMEFTVIGEAVNLTWRLQELTKDLGADLLVGADVVPLIIEDFDLRSLGAAKVRGADQPLEVFAVTGPVKVSANIRPSRIPVS
ncbi:MAG: adenylate/guanylate cyclase domain-containing protein [Verrucomicrobiota bacterium]|nr:adenylate/guanylate cyclase domain-containing protein [Verrucomicrobiota bacterium]